MKGHHSSSTVAIAAFAGITVAISACGTDAPPRENLGVVTSNLTPMMRSTALSRGKEWVDAMVPYCQSPNHQPDGDKACAATCTRPDVPEWDPYRSDCSGFVSWSWGIAAPGRTTADLAPAVTDITHTIDPMTMLPADAVNKPSDHTMLFVKWITPGKRATFMEEPGCSASMPYARQIDTDVTINGMSITIADNGITFSAIRFDGIVDDPDAGLPDPNGGSGNADSGSGSGSGSGGGNTDDAGGASANPNGYGNNGYGLNRDSGGCAIANAGASDGDRNGLGAFALAIALALLAKIRRSRT
jgi:uncharacterized membrane protein YgcG